MATFKAGDKVEFVEDYTKYAKKGDRATVVSAYDDRGERLVNLRLVKNGVACTAFAYRLKKVGARADTGGMDNLDSILAKLNDHPETKSVDVTDHQGRRVAVVVKPGAFDELMASSHFRPQPVSPTGTLLGVDKEALLRADFRDGLAFPPLGKQAGVPLKTRPKKSVRPSDIPAWLTTSEG